MQPHRVPVSGSTSRRTARPGRRRGLCPPLLPDCCSCRIEARTRSFGHRHRKREPRNEAMPKFGISGTRARRRRVRCRANSTPGEHGEDDDDQADEHDSAYTGVSDRGARCRQRSACARATARRCRMQSLSRLRSARSDHHSMVTEISRQQMEPMAVSCIVGPRPLHSDSYAPSTATMMRCHIDGVADAGRRATSAECAWVTTAVISRSVAADGQGRSVAIANLNLGGCSGRPRHPTSAPAVG